MDQTFSKTDTSKVKGLAIIIMIIHHCFLAPERYKGQIVSFAPLTEDVVNKFALAMKICVAIFTFISAYGITLSYKNSFEKYRFSGQDAERKIKKRLAALLSGFVFIFILVNIYDVLFVHDGRYFKVYGHGWRSVLYFLVDGAGLAELFSTPTYLATFWYMSLAILLILLMPVLIRLYSKVGGITVLGLAVLFRVLFPVTSEQHFAYLPNYLFCMVCGMIAADRDLIISISNKQIVKNDKLNYVLKFLAGVLAVTVLVFIRQKTRSTPLLPIWDGIIPLLICWFMHDYVNRIPVLGKGLEVLGIYSMNMFLLHNFVRIVWYYDFTYRFRNWLVIILVLLVISLGLAMVVEGLKKAIRYERLIDRLTGKS